MRTNFPQLAEVWDLDGNKYIDMSISGIGANVLGYCDPDVDDAVRSAIQKGVSSSLNCPEEVLLADLLCTIHPWSDMVRYARSGGEAMAIAVRIARAHTGRDKVAFCGYHGWQDWYIGSVGGIQLTDLIQIVCLSRCAGRQGSCLSPVFSVQKGFSAQVLDAPMPFSLHK